MSYKVDNAIIMAAGTSSRFVPLSYEMPKALLNVRGEVLIERQIRQIQQAGIQQIIVVTGYKKEQFKYLKDMFGVILVENPEYNTRNNNSSIYWAREYIKNSYICSSDNYFRSNPFENYVDDSYYSALYSEGRTNEWCMQVDASNRIISVHIGGENSWYMLGHVFWSEKFSKKFLEILECEYTLRRTQELLWESIFVEHLHELSMNMRKYDGDILFEFDSLEELRAFDPTYANSSGSVIMANIARNLNCAERELVDFVPEKNKDGDVTGFVFQSPLGRYSYSYLDKTMEVL
jgi:CTP:phosphocholine cytidylyltransferase-like protein